MAATPPPSTTAAPIVVAHAGEDAVWALWLQQIGTDAGLDLRLHRVDTATALPQPDSGRMLVLVISDHFMRHTAAHDWTRYVATPDAVLAVIVATATIPADAEHLRAVDLRLLPDETQARTKILHALGHNDTATAPHTLQRANQMRVRYPSQQMFVGYQSKTMPQHQPEWFYGREHELDTLRRQLDTAGACVLAGIAGSGKTWLAAAYVRRFRSQYDLIAWISGENGAVMRTELGQLAGPLGLPESLPRATRHLEVVDALRRSGTRYLLVYDNVTPDRFRTGREHLPLPRKPALLSDMVPWDGPGHVLLTSKVTDWDHPQPLTVPMFTTAEGADFLRRHVDDMAEPMARQFSDAVDGSPVLLNALAHRGSRGIDTVDDALLRRMRSTPFTLLDKELTASYKRAASIIGDSVRPLIDEPAGSDGWAAGQLLRLLTSFGPDQAISLALLTSTLPGSERRTGVRLPDQLADALANEHRRRNVLDLITRDSVAQVCADPLTERGRALKIHAVPWHGIRDFLPTTVADTNRHIAHQVLCDADPQRTDLPALWSRYLWLWQQIAHTEVLACTHVAHPGDPCAQLPELIRHVVEALRVQGELTAAAGLGVHAAEAWTPILGDTDIGVIRIWIVTGNALWQLGDWARARDAAMAALSGVEQVRGTYPEEYVWSSDLIAACMRTAGDWAGAVAFNEQSHAWAQECLGEGSIETVRAAHNLAVSYRVMGRFAAAMELDAGNYERFRNDPMLADDPILRLHCVNNVARNHRELGNYQASVALQERVLADFIELLGSPRQQNILRARKNLAVSYRKAGRYTDALHMQRDVLTDHVDVYGPDHPESIAARTNVANDYRLTGDHDQALEHAAEAYRRCSSGSPTHQYTAACAVNYAAALRAHGRYEHALTLDQEAVDIFTERLSAEHPYTLAAHTGLASDLAGLERFTEAVELGATVLDRCRRIRGADHGYTLQTAVNLTLDLRALGRHAEADELEADTLDRYPRALGADHPDCHAATARRRGSCDVEPPPL
ncbi:tetratricopeptide repeat protein [Nocardia cyriacigeorgica]|uniref:FxSxx-COOH system tetratricopeptide repeat protein n=1 Tax=Nocardia cyriacigeorgica TaxID=135487 RepID=UPI0013B8F365|nr:FxSxx-COOH system tetratricopeptide repeat protein [Nocardia cyriacigeorgica]NEW37823.1 tetratricopeptide repeat protein [Nocardia cyriacigeorgica]NEW48792.1 tetratricopeptide repeat protein [Nocardia cyriacigeorgica]